MKQTPKTADEIWQNVFNKKIKEESHKKWQWIILRGGKHLGKTAREIITENLEKGNKVKAGYTCTPVRGYHDRWILVKTT
jgi:hypothetical protein